MVKTLVDDWIDASWLGSTKTFVDGRIEASWLGRVRALLADDEGLGK